ncbi:hemerythrin domain-containing protein [Pseudonocardia nematodicida]|uniref:Hemerythrin domain-containing protein n=1 Tax=Pseudonocardia nematodicida TaxID=1206997 RepID=A0ABV1KF92_9PSEU
MTTARRTTPDLLGITLAHRVMRRDLHRLTDAARAIADGSPCPDRRARALDRWLANLEHEIHGHHTAEDDVAWPVIARYAGHAVDLAELSDDHGRLDPLLTAVREASFALVAAPEPGRAAPAGVLADRLAAVRDEIDEHLDAEEGELFPVIERYVPAREWEGVEAQVQKSGPGLRFMLPRIMDVLSDDELARIRTEAGPLLMVLARAVRGGYRRRCTLVFGG